MISIIVPTLNEECTIRPMLENLRLGLTEYPHEIIVSDGGSTDGTLTIARRYGKVLEYHGKERVTIAWERNQGASIAQGDFFVFLDAGVFIPKPNAFFKKAFTCFKEDPTLVALTVKLRVFPETETFADKFFFGASDYVLWFKNNILGQGGAAGKFQMVKAEAFRAVGGFREDLVVSEDNDFFARLAKHVGHTRLALGLTAYHSGRRAHTLGWPRLLWLWTKNWVSYVFLNRSSTKDWHLPTHNK